MARTLPFPAVITACLLGIAAPLAVAQAQQTPSDAPPPPQLQRIEPGSDTPVTITPKAGNRNKITQTKEGGRVTEVQVSAGGSHYVMKGVRPGSVADMNAQGGGSLRPPQWKVLEFDMNKKKKTDPEAAGAADNTVDAPPPRTVK